MLKLGFCSGNARFRYLALASGEPGPPAGTRLGRPTVGCFAGAPPDAASSLPQSSSPAQRELLQKQPRLSLYRAAPRSGSSLRKSLLPAAPRSGNFPRKSLLPPSIKQPRAARAPPKQHPPSFNRAAPRSGSSLRKSHLPPLIEQPHAAASGSSPRIRLLPPSIEQPRAAAAPQKQVPPCSPAQVAA